jgi:glutamyl-tRNA synthetase
MADTLRVRFAPSPTGYLHIGGVRTAIFNLLFARRHGGEFLLRIEDTDRERSTPEAVAQILDSLEWLGLVPDRPVVYQSQRTALYQQHIERLLAEGKAYRCYCSSVDLEAKRQAAIAAKVTYKYDRSCRDRDPNEDPAGRPFVIRFRTPDLYPDHFVDAILGRLPIDAERLDDWILVRQDGSPTYNFCVVVDDADMHVSHVIRGNDHVANTPKQILLYQALGAAVPRFGHMPLTHGPDGSKLSKRKEDEYRKLGISVSVQEYRRMGYLPHALVNYLSRLGWAHGDQEIFSRQELEQSFDLDGVGKSASVMDPDKLKWLNAHYLKETPDSELATLLAPFLSELGFDSSDTARLARIAATLKERAKTLVEMAEAARMYFEAPGAYDPKAVKKWWGPQAPVVVERVKAILAASDLQDGPAVEEQFRALSEELCEGKLGKVAQPVRIAISGSAATPSLFEVMAILGRDAVLARLDRALEELGSGRD